MPFDPTLAALRFGYGLPQPPGAPDSLAAMTGALAGPDRSLADRPGPAPAALRAQAVEVIRLAKLRGEDMASREAHKAAETALKLDVQTAARAHLIRALAAPDGFRERLVVFWANHFTAAPREAVHRYLSYALVDEAIRPHLSGRFGDLLTAVTLHPAMIRYLDQNQSYGPGSPSSNKGRRGLNENLARELIELHTLGVQATYTQADVRQMAELLTGLVIEDDQGAGFDPRRVEPGDETVLGRRYGGVGLDPIRQVLADLALRPETAAHLARKIAVHFVADAPDAGLVAAMQAAYLDTGGDLAAVYAAMLGHGAAWDPRAAKARQPLDFMIAALRALQVGPQDLAGMTEGVFRRMVLAPMSAMGQPFKAPRGPDGWPEAAEAWITPQGLAARITWAMQVPGRLVTPLPDPTEFARRALGDRAGERLLQAVARAENQREGVGLVLASPEFNRR